MQTENRMRNIQIDTVKVLELVLIWIFIRIESFGKHSFGTGSERIKAKIVFLDSSANILMFG
jgi:hypothetical protein